MPLQKITKKELLINSIQVFRKRGYYRTNMSDLAKASGLTKGVFYHHFANKADVMLHCLRTTTEWFERKAFEVAYDETLEGKVRLSRLLEACFQLFTTGEGGCFFANTLLETVHTEDTFQEEIRLFFASWKAALAHIFKTKYEANKAEELAQRALMEAEGAIVFMQLYNDVGLLRQAIDRQLAQFTGSANEPT